MTTGKTVRGWQLPQIVAQLDVPISQVEEMLPTIVVMQAEVDLHERTPFRTLRFADQPHAGFLWSAISLLRVARNARAHDVLPGGRSAPVAREDVVQIQVFPVERLAAILAGVLVPLENVVPGELDFLFRKAIEHDQQDHPGNAD